MKRLFIGMFLFGLTGLSYAQPTWHTAKINTIYPLANGMVVIRFVTDDSSCTNGNNPKYHYLAVNENGVTEDGFKNIYSSALVGAAAGKNVTINYESNTSNCFINRLSVQF